MLSDLITHEPETLSVSESLSPIRGRLLVQPLNEFTGAQYWSMLSQPGAQHGHLLTRIGLTGRQYSYPDNGRYAIDKTRVPPILRIALPKIAPDPDRLFDQLAVKVPQFPAQTVGLHHRMLLDLIAELEGRQPLGGAHRRVQHGGLSLAVGESRRQGHLPDPQYRGHGAVDEQAPGIPAVRDPQPVPPAVRRRSLRPGTGADPSRRAARRDAAPAAGEPDRADPAGAGLRPQLLRDHDRADERLGRAGAGRSPAPRAAPACATRTSSPTP